MNEHGTTWLFREFMFIILGGIGPEECDRLTNMYEEQFKRRDTLAMLNAQDDEGEVTL